MAKAIQTRPETYTFNIVTSAADTSGTIDVPPGMYHVRWVGLNTNGSADSTILFELHTTAAQTSEAETPQFEAGSAASPIVAYTIAAGTNPSGGVTGHASSVGVASPVGIPHGLKFTYVAGSATAADFTVTLTRAA